MILRSMFKQLLSILLLFYKTLIILLFILNTNLLFSINANDNTTDETTNSTLDKYSDISNEQALQTLTTLVKLYEQDKKQKSNSFVNTESFLNSIFQMENLQYTAKYLLYLIGLLITGSLFDKSTRSDLFEYLTYFATKKLGENWEKVYAMKITNNFKNDIHKHDLIIKYTKWTVGLSIVSILTWLLVKGVNKFLENPQNFPGVYFGASIPFFKIQAGVKTSCETGFDLGNYSSDESTFGGTRRAPYVIVVNANPTSQTPHN